MTAGPSFPSGTWRKATASAGDDNCVLVGVLQDGSIGVADDTEAPGQYLVFPQSDFALFSLRVKAGALKITGR